MAVSDCAGESQICCAPSSFKPLRGLAPDGVIAPYRVVGHDPSHTRTPIDRLTVVRTSSSRNWIPSRGERFLVFCTQTNFCSIEFRRIFPARPRIQLSFKKNTQRV